MDAVRLHPGDRAARAQLRLGCAGALRPAGPAAGARCAARGRAGSRVDLWSAIKLGADADRPELNQGALQRYLAEAVWYPTALFPSEHLSWTPIDERKALATLTSHGTSVSLEFHFNREGEVAAIYAPQRWMKSGR